MKKNITINMFGQLYAIDEDAYDLLKNYLDAIRQHFSKEEGGDEITDDIEGRIGELFTELKTNGIQAITIDHVEDIIKQIGSPEDMDSDETVSTFSDSQSTSRTSSSSSTANGTNSTAASPTPANGSGNNSGTRKKYYRDSKDKIIAGVLSGASNYFGGDPLAWRLGYILLVIFWNSISNWGLFDHFDIFPVGSIPIWAYILLAFLAPSAKTPEERLKMKGVDVTPQNIANEVTAETKAREKQQQYGNSRSNGCLGSFVSVMGVFAKIFIGLMSLFFFVMCIVVVVSIISLLVSPDHYFSRFIDHDTVALFQDHTLLFWVLSLSLLVILFIPGYCAFHSLLSSSGKTANMKMSQRWLWFGLWILAIVVATLSGISASKVIHEHFVEEHTHNGQYFRYNEDWTYFKRNHFELLSEEPEDKEFHALDSKYHTDGGDYYDRHRRYFMEWDYELLDYYQIGRTDTALTPGHYRLTAIARTDADGAYLYAIADNVKRLVPVPANGKEGGNIWEDAMKAAKSNPAEANAYERIISANDSCGLGWSKIEIDDIVLTGNSIQYGISTIPDFTDFPTNCTWVESMDFKLEKKED